MQSRGPVVSKRRSDDHDTVPFDTLLYHHLVDKGAPEHAAYGAALYAGAAEGNESDNNDHGTEAAPGGDHDNGTADCHDDLSDDLAKYYGDDGSRDHLHDGSPPPGGAHDDEPDLTDVHSRGSGGM